MRPDLLKDLAQSLGVPSVAEMNGDAAGGGDACGGQFGRHPASSPTAAVTGSLFQFGNFRGMVHISDRCCFRVAAWISGIEAVHIGEQD